MFFSVFKHTVMEKESSETVALLFFRISGFRFMIKSLGTK